MVLGVVAIVKPEQIIQFVVRAYPPGDRLVGVAAIMQEITVQVCAAVPQIIEGEKEKPEFPVQHKANGNRSTQNHNLDYAPASIDPVFSFDFAINYLRVFPQVAQENIPPGVFGLAIMSVAIDRNPVVAI